MKKITIAIDGYSSCGKSTLAKNLANSIGYNHVDTGAMYRCVTLYAMNNQMIENGEVDSELLTANLDNIVIDFRRKEGSTVSDSYLNGVNVEETIRGMHVSNHVSKISVIKEVRDKMVEIQRKMGSEKGVVMEGRDIGTVVFPDAEIKVFMTASIDVRVQRRYDELKSKGREVSMEEVKENVLYRDYEDTHREESPLAQAEDAIVLDNSEMTREDQLNFTLKLFAERI